MNKNLRPSFFKRLLALLIDSAILGIVGSLSGFFLEDFYASLGQYGTLLGSVIVMAYFSIFHSAIGQGQTFGKRAIGAKVIDLQGRYLSFDKSLLRSAILVLPTMNLELFSGGGGMMVVIVLLMLLIFSCIYLCLVNLSRRSLHDILVGSIVVKKQMEAIEVEEASDRTPRKLIPIAIVAAVLIGLAIYQSLSQNALAQLMAAKRRIEEQPGVLVVNEVKSGTTTYFATGKPTTAATFVSLKVRIDDKEEASNLNSKYFNDFYKIVLEEVPDARSVDGVVITLYYGYNIGIASKTTSVTKTIK